MEKHVKTRLDVAIVEMGLAASRERARALIMAGKVLVNGQREDKAGQTFDLSRVNITLKGEDHPFVSRGGLKLHKALKEFDIVLDGKRCMDIGASTGGFTDCMLQNGAETVVSIDVGFGQLDWKLRNDPRVTVYEKTNFRYFENEEYLGRMDFASMDVSFISVTKLLSHALSFLNDEGRMVVLIKPQFEAGRELVGKKGVIKDPAVHKKVITDVLEYVKSLNVAILGLSYSPIKGPEGNIEYLLYIKKSQDIITDDIHNVVYVVEAAHQELD